MDCEWGETQKRLLIEESDAWFDRHGLRLQLLRLPLQLPPNCSSWAELAQEIEKHPIHLKLLNHQRLLPKRMKDNWSFSASARNNANAPRNKNLPFKLQPFPRSIAAELPQLSRELLHEEFDGLLLTVHGKKIKKIKTKSKVRSAVGVTKVFAGCVIESLASNERQLRALWVNPRLSARSTKLLLQVLLPRAVVEAFALKAFTYTPCALPQQQLQQQQQRINSFKSVFIDRRDLDVWPRQCWLLLPSPKNFGWPLHYDIKGQAAAIHLDAGVSGSSTCSCQLTRTCLPASEQASVDRFLMVTEPLLHLLLPLRSERAALNIDRHPIFATQQQQEASGGAAKGSRKGASKANTGERKGWREFITKETDQELVNEAASIVAGDPYTPPPSLCGVDDEWCGLSQQDLLTLVSDCDEEPSRGVCTPQSSKAPSPSARSSSNNSISSSRRQTRSAAAAAAPSKAEARRLSSSRKAAGAAATTPPCSLGPRKSLAAPTPAAAAAAGAAAAQRRGGKAKGTRETVKGTKETIRRPDEAVRGTKDAPGVAAGLRRSLRSLKRSRSPSS